MEASELKAGQVLDRAGDDWRVLHVEHVDPAPLGAPYVRLRCKDHREEVRAFTLPADEPVTIRDVDG